MAGIFIDPAQSFSNALNQGLQTFKSYRDEARQDEDRAFNKRMAERQDARAETATNLMVRTSDQETVKFNEWNSPEMRELRGREAKAGVEKAESDVTLSRAQARDATTMADNRQRMIDTDIEVSRMGAVSQRISANASALSAGNGSRQVSLAERQYNDERERQQNVGAMRALFGAIQSNNFSSLTGNSAAASTVTRMATLAVGAPALAEAIQNPFGNWMNDPNKIQQILPFSGMSVAKTAAARGFKNDLRVVDMDATTRVGADGKPTRAFQFTFEGTNAKTGKRQRFVAYQAAEQFLDRANTYAKTFNAIRHSPQARNSLVQAYAAADEEGFNAIMEHEYQSRADRAALLEKQRGGSGSGPRVPNPKLDQQLAQLYREMDLMKSGDEAFASQLVFNRLGKIGAAR